MNINQFHDGETIRQQRNLTAPQKRANAYTKEGVVVNNFIKERKFQYYKFRRNLRYTSNFRRRKNAF